MQEVVMQVGETSWMPQLWSGIVALLSAALGGWMVSRVAARQLRHETAKKILGEAVSLMQGARLVSDDLMACETALSVAKSMRALPEPGQLAVPAWDNARASFTAYLSRRELDAIRQGRARLGSKRLKVIRPGGNTKAIDGALVAVRGARFTLAAYVEMEGALGAVQRVYSYMHRQQSWWRRRFARRAV